VDATEGNVDAAGCRVFRRKGVVCAMVVDYAYADVHRVDVDARLDACASSVPEPSRQEAVLFVKVWVLEKFLMVLHKSQVLDRSHPQARCQHRTGSLLRKISALTNRLVIRIKTGVIA
jgi:hypothetical protein